MFFWRFLFISAPISSVPFTQRHTLGDMGTWMVVWWICQKYSYQKLFRSDNPSSSYDGWCLGSFFETRCTKESHGRRHPGLQKITLWVRYYCHCSFEGLNAAAYTREKLIMEPNTTKNQPCNNFRKCELVNDCRKASGTGRDEQVFYSSIFQLWKRWQWHF